MKVSVVVPVFNTGAALSRCADSLVGQTLDDYEVIFADDGSDDGTERRLDELAAAHPRVRVLHLPPSGGPGGPRNAGLEAARGDYVYFLDDDDWLGSEALERMHAMAVRNDADIVIGKMVGHGRPVPRAMFRRSVDRADVLGDHLCGILTPHKMFRRSFLRGHGIRFPEGPVRLEDHRFVLRAYFRARTISVLADYPCCHWVRREGSYSRRRPSPGHYYDALREILDIVDQHVEPGPTRDRFHAHWYRGKILKRLGEKDVLAAPEEYRLAVYREARRVVVDRIGEGVDRLLPVRLRVRSALLRGDAREELFRLLEVERDVRLDAALHSLRWDGQRLIVRFGARFIYGDGMPLEFRGGRWVPPVALALPGELLDASADGCRLDLYVRRRADGADHTLPLRAETAGPFAMSGESVVDLAVDQALTPGVWDFVVRLSGGGWLQERRLSGGTGVVGRGRLEPYRTEKGNLSLRVYGEAESASLRRMLKRLPGARAAARRLRG